ncbi:MAG: LysR substrate-binding domain-containing protein [Phenylobacterium sp.]
MTTFVAVAERGSFAKAAGALGRSTSTVSHAIRTLEEGLQIRLINRTTRSVALTEAGERLLARIQPLLGELADAVESLNEFRDEPRGRLRLSVSSMGLSVIVASVVRDFTAAYPDVTLEVTVDDEEGDLLDGRADAGIRGLGRIPKDMITVRVGPATRWVAVASPEYLAQHGEPQALADLAAHNCILFRFASGAHYRWELQESGRTVEIPVSGTVVTDNIDLMVRAAVGGVGICYTNEAYAASHLEAGRLVVVLEAHALPMPGWYLYYPSRRNMPAALKAFLEFVRRPSALAQHAVAAE